jgi:hypothetical protein
VETENIDKVVALYGPATKLNAIVGGQVWNVSIILQVIYCSNIWNDLCFRKFIDFREASRDSRIRRTFAARRSYRDMPFPAWSFCRSTRPTISMLLYFHTLFKLPVVSLVVRICYIHYLI